MVQSVINLAENPKYGAASIRAFETIARLIGQDEPEQRQDALETLQKILEANRENARLQAESETE